MSACMWMCVCLCMCMHVCMHACTFMAECVKMVACETGGSCNYVLNYLHSHIFYTWVYFRVKDIPYEDSSTSGGFSATRIWISF